MVASSGITADLRAGRLQEVLPEWTIPETGHPRGDAATPLRAAAVRAFVDFLNEKFGGAPPWER